MDTSLRSSELHEDFELATELSRYIGNDPRVAQGCPRVMSHDMQHSLLLLGPRQARGIEYLNY
jgi:hypothetical protein